MKQENFEHRLVEFCDKKKDIEENARKSIRKLAETYESDAIKSGYVFDETTQSFKFSPVYAMELVLSCQGKDIYPSPKELVHEIGLIKKESFDKYVSCFNDTAPGKEISVETMNKIVETTKLIATEGYRFKSVFAACFSQCGENVTNVLGNHGLDIYKYPRIFAKGSEAYMYSEDYSIVDYYGGFEFYLPCIQCEVHFFTTTTPSYLKMTAKLGDDTSILLKEATPLVRIPVKEIIHPFKKK